LKVFNFINPIITKVEYGKLTYGDIFGGKALLELANIQK